MIYKDKVLINRTGKKVEFMHAHRLYTFEPGEKKLLDGVVADHALRFFNTGLEEYVEGMDAAPKKDFSKLSWRELVSLAKGKGYKVGMDRKEVIALLENVRPKA